MTRRDVTNLASLIATLPENTSRDVVAQKVADLLSTDRPFFDAAKFLNIATTVTQA